MRDMGGRGKKNKYRPQDPASKKVDTTPASANAPPAADELDVPRCAGRAFMPIEPKAGGTGKVLNVSARQARKEKLQQKRRLGDSSALDRKVKKRRKLDVDDTADHVETAEVRPSQKPGESDKAFAKRAGKDLADRAAQARKKMNTEQRREKNRLRAAEKKRKLKDKRKARTADNDHDKQLAGQKAKFGDIVERPPIMSASVLRSREKLKASEKAVVLSLGGKSAAGGAAANGAPKDLADYASRVQEAYAALKARRLAA